MHMIISQLIYIISFWNVALFFIDVAIYIIPLVLNIVYLVGSDTVKNFIVHTRFRHVIDLYVFAISLLFIGVIVWMGAGASAIKYTEFLSLL